MIESEKAAPEYHHVFNDGGAWDIRMKIKGIEWSGDKKTSFSEFLRVVVTESGELIDEIYCDEHACSISNYTIDPRKRTIVIYGELRN